MVLPLLALLGAAPQALELGVGLYNKFFGSGESKDIELLPNANREELESAVANLRPEQREIFMKELDIGVEKLKVTNEMIAIQEKVDPDMLDKLSQNARDEVVMLRTTTRPKIVLRMSHVILLPVYVTALDLFSGIVNVAIATFNYKHTVPYISKTLLASNINLFTSVYNGAALTAAGVIATYMGLREVGKHRQKKHNSGNTSGLNISGVINTVKSILGSLNRK